MVWRTLLCVLVLAAGTGFLVHHAMTQTQTRTIAEFQSYESAVGTIALRGKVVGTQENTFVLDDGTGRAEVSTCPTWYKQINLCVGEPVTVLGRVIPGAPPSSTRSKFVICAYKILRAHEVIEIRGKPGKPPWATQRTPDDVVLSP